MLGGIRVLEPFDLLGTVRCGCRACRTRRLSLAFDRGQCQCPKPSAQVTCVFGVVCTGV